MENILEVNNLTKHFSGFSLNKISFSLPKGYIMGFIGPNGAGKSTTLKLLLNLLKKDGGEIKIFGLDSVRDQLAIKNRIGFVFDESFYYENLSIDEIIRVISPHYQRWDAQAFKRWMKTFQIHTRQKINEMSKGMKLKLSLAIALSHHAELLIMDEPTAGLDPIVRRDLLDILTGLLQDENMGIFFSTHIVSDLEKIADYITLINQGNIIFSENKDQVLEEFKLVKGEKELLTSAVRAFFIGIRENHFGFEGLLRNPGLLPPELKEHILVERPTLEEIMLYTVKGEDHA
ncbi:ABC transporter ATP-binding protein [Desulfitobacterium sp.]|uniref:ABC transporter ATP-binding protein n=1 Tax=Desulfitobacterium sp. TaxID=49981 RepID=UPI002BD6655A|nr:ABC transporter ATP-binding protein [Desulfitobacterium sp.]HVJ48560.1 ABC transporter ATP-binding protein [Desulfitobacterium sp.]